MRDDIVKTRVVTYQKKQPQSKHNGWNRPGIEAGETVYLLEYAIGGYFTYGYRTAKAAEDSRKNQIQYNNNTRRFYEFNVVDSPEKAIITDWKGND